MTATPAQFCTAYVATAESDSLREQPDVLREIRDNQIRLKQNVQRALTSKPSSNAYKFAGPGTSEDLGKSAAQSIVDISKEYAFNTMLKAELRKNKPSVPTAKPLCFTIPLTRRASFRRSTNTRKVLRI